MKLFLTTAAIVALATPVLANEKATDVRVFDHVKTVTTQIPVNRTECQNVQVPIYGNAGGGASGADVLGGMILGGLLGKGVGGNDKGAAAGAILGGVIAADKGQNKQRVVGYKQERQCFDTVSYQNQTQEVYSHSTIRFTVNGYRYVQQFQRSDR